MREKKKVRDFPRNEYAYSREIEGGKNEGEEKGEDLLRIKACEALKDLG